VYRKFVNVQKDVCRDVSPRRSPNQIQNHRNLNRHLDQIDLKVSRAALWCQFRIHPMCRLRVFHFDLTFEFFGGGSACRVKCAQNNV